MNLIRLLTLHMEFFSCIWNFSCSKSRRLPQIINLNIPLRRNCHYANSLNLLRAYLTREFSKFDQGIWQYIGVSIYITHNINLLNKYTSNRKKNIIF